MKIKQKILLTILCAFVGVIVYLVVLLVRDDNQIANGDWQPTYRPLDKEVLTTAREVGKTYHNEFVGKVFGKGINEDWWLKGICSFQYFYHVESNGKIISNDGETIIEERTFEQAEEHLFVDDVKLGFDLPLDKYDMLIKGLSYAGKGLAIMSTTADGGACLAPIITGISMIIEKSAPFRNWLEKLNTVEIDLTVLNEALENAIAREWLHADWIECKKSGEKVIGRKIVDGKDIAGTDIDQFLKGKTVRITFQNGVGITNLEPIDCSLTKEEEKFIKRGNFIFEQYIMSGSENEGDDWIVDAELFGGFLDSRMEAHPMGKVGLHRRTDGNEDGQVVKYVEIKKGSSVALEDITKEGKKRSGNISEMSGTCEIVGEDKLVRKATLQGIVRYSEIKPHHLLFKTEFKTKPRLDIQYTCEKKD